MSYFENLSTLSVNKEFSESVNEICENKEIRTEEVLEYSEEDIERMVTAADVMSEIFNDEVICNWENLSVEERASYVTEYYVNAGEALGIHTEGIVITDLFELLGENTYGGNCGNGWLLIDTRLVENPDSILDLLEVVTHEMRHQLQSDALENPEAFSDIPRETLEQWEYEMNNYNDGTYDFEGYSNQAIEMDAEVFALGVVSTYLIETLVEM